MKHDSADILNSGDVEQTITANKIVKFGGLGTQYLMADGTVTIGTSATNDYVDSIAFNTGDGILTLGRTGVLSDLTQDLDGRYPIIGSVDNYNGWDLFVNGTQQTTILSGQDVKFVAGTNVTLGYSANTITINSTGGTGGSQNLQQVTDIGNDTTNSIRSYDYIESYVSSTQYGRIDKSNLYLRLTSSYAIDMVVSSGQLRSKYNSSNQAILQFPQATAARTITLQDKTGTIALLSDVTAGAVVSVSGTGAINVSPTTGAVVVSHLETAGFKHIPSGGAAGQILVWSANGTAVWGSGGGGSGAVDSVFGRTGVVVAVGTDYDGYYLGLTASAADSYLLGGNPPSFYLNYDNLVNTPTIPSTDGLVPYLGAIADVDIGSYDMSAAYFRGTSFDGENVVLDKVAIIRHTTTNTYGVNGLGITSKVNAMWIGEQIGGDTRLVKLDWSGIGIDGTYTYSFPAQSGTFLLDTDLSNVAFVNAPNNFSVDQIINADVYANDFIGTSDVRLKENIKTHKLFEINSNYVDFNFIGNTQKRVGVIAQELEKTHPEFVRTDDSGKKSVSYSDLHSAEIAYLKEEIKNLKNTILSYGF